MVRIGCEAILFDLDGVLIDSTPAVTRVWSRWAAERGLNPEEVVRRAHGRPSILSIAEFLPGSDYEAENLIVERGELEDLGGVVPLPGAVELLSMLPDDRWTIVTSCTRRLAEARLHAAGIRIPERMVTASDIKKGKPDPEPYIKGAVALGVAAENCVVIEDAPAGVRSGKSAGARVIAVTTTAPASDLTGADWMVGGCQDVQASVEERGLSVSLDL